MNSPHWKLTDDGQTLVVTFPTERPVEFHLDAEGVDDLIANLAEMRMSMPQMPMGDPDPGTKLNVPTDGRWYVQPLPNGQKVLAIFHPGYRWVGLLLDDGAVENLANALVADK